MRRKRLKLTAIASLLLAGAGLFACRSAQEPARKDPVSGYIDPAACAGCHQQIFQSWRRTGMGRSISRPGLGKPAEDFGIRNRLFNAASDRYYTMLERDGKVYQKRHQIGFGGAESNVVEKEIDLIIGSGNHARSYAHRGPDGKLFQLPVTWYSELGGYWAMSPGYDRAAQPDFRRTLSDECLFCHASYPAKPGAAEAIDCQRCHGPGGEHTRIAGSGKAAVDAIRRAIVNPARLSRDRQLDTCMQCHLETTSRELPHAIRRYERELFSYRPGEPLGDYEIAFDHAPGAGRDDKFEIAHAAYRLRKSACFRESQMTCTTCHNPHEEYNAPQAAQRYVAACKGCHAAAHEGARPARDNCVECHMSKRRAEDAVHVVMTDHYIQRRPKANLLAALREQDFSKLDTYRGVVVPDDRQPAAERLYVDVAQVKDGANLEAGIRQLQEDLAQYQGGRPEPYYELGEAYGKVGNRTESIRWYGEALRRRPDFRPALQDLGAALIATGDFAQAARVLESAVSGPAPEAGALVNLAAAYMRQNKTDAAQRVLKRALNVDPDLPEALNLSGLLAAQNGDRAGAEVAWRTAIANQPDFAEARYNLANLLAAGGVYTEAEYQFGKAIAIQPAYVEAHQSYANLLVLRGSMGQAAAEFRETLRLDPGLAQAHSDFGHVLAAQGNLQGAIGEYRRAVQLKADLYEAHLALAGLLARKGSAAEARIHLMKASESPDPEVGEIARKALR